MTTRKKVRNRQIHSESHGGNSGEIASETETGSLWHETFVHAMLIVVAGFVVYFNTMASPFFFDDVINIGENAAIKNFNCFPDTSRAFGLAIVAEVIDNIILRPVTYFSLAINYALHGLNHFGYHITNLLLHIGNALMVYLLFTRIQATPTMTTESAPTTRHRWFLPFFAALLFVCHPVQTQAVVYIIQRSVLLTTFFYLGALVLYDTCRTAPSRKIKIFSYIAALAATLLAMGSKEIAYTLPVIILLYEVMFFTGKLATRLYKTVPFLLTMTIIPLKLNKLAELDKVQNIENMQNALSLRNINGATPFEYLITQFGVITTYLRLLFVPVNQNLDYDYPLQTSFFSLQVILPLLLLLAIAGFGAFCLMRSQENKLLKIVAFGIFWFFITISVESSIVPIKDLIFEHRVYLPSAGFFMALLTGVALLYNRYTAQDISQSKISTLVIGTMVVIMAGTAISRNKVWQSELTLWRDVVKKSPNKSRGHTNLAASLLPSEKYLYSPLSQPQTITDLNRLNEAIHEGREAIRLDPSDINTYIIVSKALSLQNRLSEALQYITDAIRIKPNEPKLHVAQGEMYLADGKLQDAEQKFREALALQPLSVMARWRLAYVLAIQGDRLSAIQELEHLVRIYPDATVKQKLDELKRG